MSATRTSIVLLALAAALWLIASSAWAAPQVEFFGLTDNNTLVRFSLSRPAETRSVKVTGVKGALLGIDFRPADRRLYAVTGDSLYTIDPASGAATFVNSLSVGFTGRHASGVDFNPTADRLRLVGSDRQSLRVNVELGATAQDGALAYAAGDINARKKPTVTAAAYTESVAGAKSTKLFDIDTGLDVLVFQDPPNDGTLQTVGPLGVDFGPQTGFDILTDANGVNRAFAASGSVLYTIDLLSGKAARVGPIGNGSLKLVGLAVVPG